MSENNNENYSAKNIQVLEGLEAVRKRPSMYIGDIGVRGLHHLIWEVVDNSIDEALAGFCTNIKIILNNDQSITVIDNGRGIPTDMHPKEHKSALEVVMTILHAGGKFDKGTYKVSGGLHGVGISCVNALSSYLKATIHRNGKIYEQEYKQGKPLNEVHEIGNTDITGTTINFIPDTEIFTTTIYNYDTIAFRLKELSFLNVGVTLELEDNRNQEAIQKETFVSEKGLDEFVEYVDSSRDKIIPHPIYIENEKQDIQISLEYNTDCSENIISYVNNINTIEGGTHVTGFRRALTRTLKTYAEKSKLLEKSKVEIIGDDFREGLTAIISVKVSEPQFEGQTKTKLGNDEIIGYVDNCVSTKLSKFLEEHPNEAKSIISKIILAAQARNAARKARELVQRKNVLSSSGLPGKLADCSDNDPEKCELFIVEGNSAGGTAKQGRDRNYQAILPLRGKILNVEKAQEHKIYDNEQISNIILATGVSFGTEHDIKALNLEKLRYHKIIIMADADVDGSHISTLVLTLFYRYMRSLIENGYVYIAMPPLYLIKKGNEKVYGWNEEDRIREIQRLSKNSNMDAVTVQRYKGLGEMNAEQLWETTMNPETRTLKQVTLESAMEADKIFSTLMGDDVEPRRLFIEQHATYARLDI